jgi:pSer/pThr/pTyr-binding forkhead associated (FHA) protein
MIKFLVKFGDESREVEFDVPEISIGRSTDNVLPLPDKKSSRKHAKIEKINGEYLVNDLGSGNGTKVNGKDVNTHVLSKGDEIAIGLTTLYVLTLDTPARPAVLAPPPAAIPAAVPVAVASGAPAPTARAVEKPSEGIEEARRKATRRNLARSNSGWVGTAASILVLIGIAAGGWYLYDKHEKDSAQKAEERRAQEYKSNEKYREAETAYKKFSKAAEADPVEDSMITEAATLAETHGALYPEFDALVARLKQRRSEQIGRDDFASVDTRIQGALRERRFGDALQALKDLKANTDSSAAGNLVAKVCDSINQEFKSIDDYGRKLADDKKYSIAADHYRLQTPRFKGTEHFAYLKYKPDALEQLKKVEAETAVAKGNRPPEPDTSIAKAEASLPKEGAKPEPVAPKPEPVMPKPEPVMPKPEPAKPAPAMPKETPKPPPPPPPPPKPPPPEKKEEEKKEDIGAGIKGFKKPDVLCDCKKIIKGVYCTKCDRMLAQEDMRNGVCKRCEEKPKKIDLCVKKYYMVDGQPDKRSEKPILFEGKLYDFAYEDKARIFYLCDGCQEAADASGDVKHKPDCASKNVIKVCSKSGAPPHGGEKK